MGMFCHQQHNSYSLSCFIGFFNRYLYMLAIGCISYYNLKMFLFQGEEYGISEGPVVWFL